MIKSTALYLLSMIFSSVLFDIFCDSYLWLYFRKTAAFVQLLQSIFTTLNKGFSLAPNLSKKIYLVTNVFTKIISHQSMLLCKEIHVFVLDTAAVELKHKKAFMLKLTIFCLWVLVSFYHCCFGTCSSVLRESGRSPKSSPEVRAELTCWWILSFSAMYKSNYFKRHVCSQLRQTL